jgi:hypothetical protein
MKGRTRDTDSEPVEQEVQVIPLEECKLPAGEDGLKLKVEKVEQANALVVLELPGILQALVKKAKEGSYLHAKCVFEFARIAEIELPKVEKPEPWVEELLTALRAVPDPAQAPSAI